MANYPVPELGSNAQTRTALATALGMIAILAEELVRSGAIDAGRLEERIDHFVLSASVASGTEPGEAQYVEQIVKLIKSGLVAAGKEHHDE